MNEGLQPETETPADPNVDRAFTTRFSDAVKTQIRIKAEEFLRKRGLNQFGFRHAINACARSGFANRKQP